MESDSEKKVWKSVNIWCSCGQEIGVLFLTDNVVVKLKAS